MRRVLTWNLCHGRSVPPAGRYLFEEFSAALAAWEWDLALLQEVPPWWPPALARACEADHRLVLTSRNALLALRRSIATRWPDVIKSNGGGANAILARGGAIVEQRTRLLCLTPERRQLHAVRLRDGTWVGNLHATVRNDPRARREAAVASTTMLAWGGDSPLVLGGDFNVRGLELPGMQLMGGHDVDLVFAHGFNAPEGPEVLERGALSDHAPVRVGLV